MHSCSTNSDRTFLLACCLLIPFALPLAFFCSACLAELLPVWLRCLRLVSLFSRRALGGARLSLHNFCLLFVVNLFPCFDICPGAWPRFVVPVVVYTYYSTLLYSRPACCYCMLTKAGSVILSRPESDSAADSQECEADNSSARLAAEILKVEHVSKQKKIKTNGASRRAGEAAGHATKRQKGRASRARARGRATEEFE